MRLTEGQIFIISRLSPIVELFFTPWNDKDALEGVSHRKNRQILFETGEGLNVYEELVASNAFYYHTFTRFIFY